MPHDIQQFSARRPDLLLSGKESFMVHGGCIQRKTWRMGPYAGVDYNSPHIIVNSIVNYSPPNTKGNALYSL